MPGVTDLETRVLDAVRGVAATFSAATVPASRVYRRDVLAFDPDRDGPPPAVLVGRTPGRSYTRVKSLSWVTWTFPVTCLLVASQGGAVKTAEDWRTGWGPKLTETLDGAALVGEVINVNVDSLAQLDPAAFTQAGLWVSTVSVLVLARTPFPPL